LTQDVQRLEGQLAAARKDAQAEHDATALAAATTTGALATERARVTELSAQVMAAQLSTTEAHTSLDRQTARSKAQGEQLSRATGELAAAATRLAAAQRQVALLQSERDALAERAQRAEAAVAAVHESHVAAQAAQRRQQQQAAETEGATAAALATELAGVRSALAAEQRRATEAATVLDGVRTRLDEAERARDAACAEAEHAGAQAALAAEKVAVVDAQRQRLATELKEMAATHTHALSQAAVEHGAQLRSERAEAQALLLAAERRAARATLATVDGPDGQQGNGAVASQLAGLRSRLDQLAGENSALLRTSALGGSLLNTGTGAVAGASAARVVYVPRRSAAPAPTGAPTDLTEQNRTVQLLLGEVSRGKASLQQANTDRDRLHAQLAGARELHDLDLLMASRRGGAGLGNSSASNTGVGGGYNVGAAASAWRDALSDDSPKAAGYSDAPLSPTDLGRSQFF
jgi:hypothetical protein